MVRNCVVYFLIFIVFFAGFSLASAIPPPAKIVSGVVSNLASVFWKWLLSLKSTTTKPAVSSRSMMRFESGYNVETVFDGSKLGIEPHSVQVSPGGELLVLDSENSNIYKISMPLFRSSRPKLVTGSPQGYSGHVDGRLREAILNHPQGLTVDDKGNVYVADTMNMAIRKISDAGVTTIAGGKRGRGGGHVDGPSEDAKFSSDFDVVYVGSSCSLLVIDRGNQAIREIQLHDDDCSYQNENNFNLGLAVLLGAGFFGYMLALLQRRIQLMFSSQDFPQTSEKKSMQMHPYQSHSKVVRPPLIPHEDEPEKQEGLFGSLGRLVVNIGSSVTEILTGFFTGSRRKPIRYPYQETDYQQQQSKWPMQESFMIRDEDEPPPPSLETRQKSTYTRMTSDLKPKNPSKQMRPYHNEATDYSYQQHQRQLQLQRQQHMQMQRQQMMQHRTDPTTYYEKSCGETNEVVFGAVQQQDGQREAMVVKGVDYADNRVHDHHNIRPRLNYMGYSMYYGY